MSAASRPSGPLVLKLGGRSLAASGAETELARELARMRAPAVIVHGGGDEVSRWCARLAIQPRFVDGRRVTDPATLEVAVAVLAGLVNKRLVTILREADVDAVGLSAADGGVLEVARHADAERLGEVGSACGVKPAMLEMLLESGFTPVLSSVGALGGALLNLNADEVAGAVAGALGARALVLLTDVDGVSTVDGHVPRLDPAGVATLIAGGDARDGMIPKLEAASAAVQAGAARAVIGAWRGPGSLAGLVSGSAPCTIVAPASPEAARA